MKGKKIGDGRTAEVFEYGEGKALKLFRDWYPRDAAEWDFKTSRTVALNYAGAPQVSGSVEIDGRFGIIFERIDGASALGHVMRHPLQSAAVGRRLAETQTQMHKASSEGLPSQKEGLRQQIGRASELSPAEKERIINYLETLPDGSALCHGDFHPDNLLFSTRGDVVIDFVTANSGAAACDIARTSLILDSKAVPPDMGFLMRLVLAFLRKLCFKAYRRRVLSLSGLGWREVNAWFLPLAAARLVEENAPDEQRDLLAIVRKGLKAIS